MSYESESVLPAGASPKAVREFLALFGYEKSRGLKYGSTKFDRFYWFDATDYRSWSGVEVSLYLDGHRRVIVGTRTPIARSYYDLTHQNKTIFELQRRFGGSFRTDEGPRRYLKPDSGPPGGWPGFSLCRSGTVGAPLLRFLQGRVRRCRYHRVSSSPLTSITSRAA